MAVSFLWLDPILIPDFAYVSNEASSSSMRRISNSRCVIVVVCGGWNNNAVQVTLLYVRVSSKCLTAAITNALIQESELTEL